MKRFLKQKEVCEATGLSRAHIWRLRQSGEFPKAVSLSERRIGFVENEIKQWMQEKELAR